MSFNTKKCHLLSVQKKGRHVNSQYKLHGNILETVEHNPYLGVELQSDLKWDHHIKQITGKANRSLAFLRRNLPRCPEQTKERAYIALVRPHVESASAVWDPHLKKDIKEVEKIERRAARFVKGVHKREDRIVTQLLNELEWPALETRRKCHRLELLHASLHGRNPGIAIPPHLSLPIHRFNTRSQATIINPATKGDTYKNSFFPRTITDYNKLLPNIRRIKPEAPFKLALRAHFNV